MKEVHRKRQCMKKKTRIKWLPSFQFIPFAHETGMSQETMHNTVRRAELVNPICVTQHPDNWAIEKKHRRLGRREAYWAVMYFSM